MTAMRHGPFATRLRHRLIACGFGALLALGSAVSAKAQTQAADDDEDTFEQRIIKGILGGMGVNVGGRGIEYRERSPLVIPPSLDLPPPDAVGAAARNPAWPREQERAKKVATQNKAHTLATPEEPGTSSRMTADEMRRTATPRGQRVTDPSKSGSQEDIDIGRPLRPNELGSSSIFSLRGLMGGSGTEQATFEGEPGRGSLTQPPPGYQTPSAAQPYGTAAEKTGGWKIPTILSRPEGTPNN